MTENPLLLPLNKEKTMYDGFITVQVCKLAGNVNINYFA